MGGRGSGSRMAGGGGSSGMRGSANLSRIESRIRSNPVETAALIGPNGDVLFDKSDGIADAVYFTAEETSMMVDGTLTHNHPGGTTFSKEDVDLTVSRGIRSIRAVHSDGSYELKRQYNIGDNVPRSYFRFAEDYDSAVNKYMKDTVDKIWNDTGDADRCNGMVADYRRQWLRDNSASYGWEYKEGN